MEVLFLIRIITPWTELYISNIYNMCVFMCIYMHIYIYMQTIVTKLCIDVDVKYMKKIPVTYTFMIYVI